MAKYLVIVESPAKVKTIKKFLGANYEVEASNGHVRDFPKSQFGIDVENDFEPKYITIRGKGELLAKLRKAAKKADKIYLATDPDREGEAISWHLMQALKEDPDKMDKQLSVLKHLVYILTGSAVESMEKLYEDTIKHAEELGISVQISGNFPLYPSYRVLADRAIRECVTNCARHAHGNVVFVKIDKYANEYNIRITNDGDAPEKKCGRRRWFICTEKGS